MRPALGVCSALPMNTLNKPHDLYRVPTCSYTLSKLSQISQPPVFCFRSVGLMLYLRQILEIIVF